MQIAVVSGKGGTGKTSIAVGLATEIKNSIKIDADVDASNLYLFYQGEKISVEPFYMGKTAKIDLEKCIKCHQCERACQFGAINYHQVDPLKCEGCGVCALVCPVGAITLKENKVANIEEIKLIDGDLIRAEMKIGADGAGKLITALRNKVVGKDGIIIIDSSPGIGCPVIAAMINTDLCLVVTEPTLSGLADLKRMVLLGRKLRLKLVVCINKYDLNLTITKQIKAYCKEEAIKIIGLVPYDELVVTSINELKPIVTYKNSLAGKEIKAMATRLEGFNENSNRT